MGFFLFFLDLFSLPFLLARHPCEIKRGKAGLEKSLELPRVIPKELTSAGKQPCVLLKGLTCGAFRTVVDGWSPGGGNGEARTLKSRSRAVT